MLSNLTDSVKLFDGKWNGISEKLEHLEEKVDQFGEELKKNKENIAQPIPKELRVCMYIYVSINQGVHYYIKKKICSRYYVQI